MKGEGTLWESWSLSLIRAVSWTVLITDQSLLSLPRAPLSSWPLFFLDSFYLFPPRPLFEHVLLFIVLSLFSSVSSLRRSSLSSLPGVHSRDYLFIYTPMQTPADPATHRHTAVRTLTATTPRGSSRHFVLQTSVSYFVCICCTRRAQTLTTRRGETPSTNLYRPQKTLGLESVLGQHRFCRKVWLHFGSNTLWQRISFPACAPGWRYTRSGQYIMAQEIGQSSVFISAV